MLSSATRWRISGVAGLLFVVISFVASAINVQPPPYTQDSAAIAAWFAENSQQYRVGHRAFSSWLGGAGVLIGMTAIVGSAALVENDPAGPFASINGFAWLAYFLWLAALSIAMVRGARGLQLVAEGREAPLDP